MRLPVIPSVDTKDGVTNKNARMTNMLKETKSFADVAVLRPGLVSAAVASGNGNGLVRFNDKLVSVYGQKVKIQNGADDNVTETVMPSASQWYDIAASITTLCIVGSGTASATSGDSGLTWTSHPLPASKVWTKIAHNGTVFCAIPAQSGTYSATSADEGVTWTPRTLAFEPGFPSLAALGTKFCVIDDDGSTATSTDNGATWASGNPIDPDTTTGWTGLVATDTCFVAINSENLSAATSADGVSWSVVANALPSNSGVFWVATAWNGHAIAAIGFSVIDAVSYVATSSDGRGWALVNTSALDADLVARARYITATDSVILITTQNSDSASYSADSGKTWAMVSLPTTGLKIWTAIGGVGSVFAGAAFANTKGFSFTPSTLVSTVGTVESGFYDFAQSPI